jgi:PKHD-type hydroxylase
MITNYYIRKILNESELSRINELIHISNENNYWGDGIKSGGGSHSVKKNTELSDDKISKEINDIIMESLDKDRKFLSYTVADSTNWAITSKTSSGNYYHPHMDNWKNGDYSTTVFLNSPDDYVGGELCLYLGNDGEKKIKLGAGWAITYQTGILHRVNEVIRGTRYVSVFWTKSLIKNPEIRNLLYQIDLLTELIEENYSPIHKKTFESALRDPLFVANNLKNEIMRIHGEK